MKEIIRKPDLETESFRMWSATKTESKGIEKGEFKIKYKDMEVGLCGFTLAKDKKTGEIVFAYKYKTDSVTKNPSVMVWAKNKSDENDFMREVKEKTGLHVMSVTESLKNLYVQQHVMDKISKKNNS